MPRRASRLRWLRWPPGRRCRCRHSLKQEFPCFPPSCSTPTLICAPPRGSFSQQGGASCAPASGTSLARAGPRRSASSTTLLPRRGHRSHSSRSSLLSCSVRSQTRRQCASCRTSTLLCRNGGASSRRCRGSSAPTTSRLTEYQRRWRMRIAKSPPLPFHRHLCGRRRLTLPSGKRRNCGGWKRHGPSVF